MTAGIKRAVPEEGFNPYSHQKPESLFYAKEGFRLGSWDNSLLEYLRDSLLPADKNWAHGYLFGEKLEEADDWWPKEGGDYHYASLRVACEDYARNSNLDEKEKLLKKIEALIVALKKNWFPADQRFPLIIFLEQIKF